MKTLAQAHTSAASQRVRVKGQAEFTGENNVLADLMDLMIPEGWNGAGQGRKTAHRSVREIVTLLTASLNLTLITLYFCRQ